MMFKLAEPHIMSITPYVPGHIGGASDISLTELASNENCLGPSPAALEAAHKGLSFAHQYPNNQRTLVIQKICRHLSDWAITPSQIALGNGSSELIVNLVRGLLSAKEAILTGWPTFIMYRQAAMSQARQEVTVDVLKDMSFDLEAMLRRIHQKNESPIKLLFLANPNNPTGNYIGKSQFDNFVAALPKDLVLIIDEAYFEYVVAKDYPNGLAYIRSRPRTVVLRTFSKIYGLAGLRLGYAIGDEDIIDVLCRVRDPFNVNVAVQYAAMAALDDNSHVERSIRHNLSFKPMLVEGLNKAGFKAHDGVANFVLAERAPSMPNVHEICRELMKQGVVVRPMTSFGLPNHIRVTVGTNKELSQLFQGLKETVGSHQPVAAF